ncbi:MAG: hypothetical protein JW939_08680 [Candidatus Thermoplasmatota archaeon]|nr:hypothetical protein [Candidatus Thermoplasmatota archaeon]
MGCFILPGGEAIATTILMKVLGRERAERLKLKWLNIMLWGGFIVLAVEHVWHGEVVPWPPFLTAMENPADIAPMLHEMALIGGSMSIVITMTWAVMVAIYNAISRKDEALREVKA